MPIIFEYIWVFFVLAPLINGAMLHYRSKKYIKLNPELEEGYKKYIRNFVFYSSIPWVIVMIGEISGLTNSMTEYMNPKAMNPIVLIFHASIVILWILSAWWVYFQDGAEFIENHPGLWGKKGLNGTSNLTAKQVKLLLPLMLLGGAIAMVMMWVIDIPTLPL